MNKQQICLPIKAVASLHLKVLLASDVTLCVHVVIKTRRQTGSNFKGDMDNTYYLPASRHHTHCCLPFFMAVYWTELLVICIHLEKSCLYSHLLMDYNFQLNAINVM